MKGDVVDNIEANVSKSVDHIEVAKTETKKAVKYQSKARKKKIIVAVVCVVLAIIIISVIISQVV